MSILSLRTTLMALFGAVASAREIKLNFEDLSINNDAGCGQEGLKAPDAYNGFFLSTNLSNKIMVYNTTKTAACSSAKDIPHKTHNPNPFGRAVSSPNVAYANDGRFEIIRSGGALVKGVSYDLNVDFTAAEVKARGLTLEVDTYFSTFVKEVSRTKAVFHPATDGFGPYHVVAPNSGGNYTYLYVQLSVSETKDSAKRTPDLYFDNVVLQTFEK